MSNDKLSILEALDQTLSVRPRNGDQRAALSRRSLTHAELGLPASALEDSIRAYLNTEGELDALLKMLLGLFHETPDRLVPAATEGAAPAVPNYALSARLAEALRVYVRDVLLSRQPGDATNMVDAIECSISLFNQAESDLSTTRGARLADDDPELTWIRAHRGAARAVNFWMFLTNGSVESAKRAFREADRDFVSTKQKSGVPYVWSIRFRAYLHALRAEPGDFALACALLERVMEADNDPHSSIHRSLSMLYSYQAAAKGADPEVRRDAARAGVAAGAAATEQDSEDYVAAYFTAANWWWLAICEPDATKRETHKKAHSAAIKTARTRSMNAISLALATLAGLQLMESLHPCELCDLGKTAPIDKSEADKVIGLMQSFLLVFPPDLETRLIFRRDPIWSAIREQIPSVYAQFASGLTYEKLDQYFAAPSGTRKS